MINYISIDGSDDLWWFSSKPCLNTQMVHWRKLYIMHCFAAIIYCYYICELGKSWDELRNSSPNVEKMRVFGIQDWFLTMCDAFEMKPSLEARPWTLRSTVDGRNPAPVDRWFIPLSIGFQPSKMVQDFFHPQYHWISPQLYFASNSSRIH